MGDGVTVPLGAADESDQDPPLRLQAVAFVLDHVSVGELPDVTVFSFEEKFTVGTGNAVTVYVAVTVAIRGFGDGVAEVPVNWIVAVYGTPAVNPVEFAVTVTNSDAFPEALLVRPEDESDGGETVSQVAVEGITDAVHVSFDPGEPVFVICTCVVAELPAVEFNVTAVGLAPMPAIGFQSRMKFVVPEVTTGCVSGLVGGNVHASAVDPNIPFAKENIAPINPPLSREEGANFTDPKAYCAYSLVFRSATELGGTAYVPVSILG